MSKRGRFPPRVWTREPAQIGDKISFVFSWQLWKWLEKPREDITIGGPAVVLNREWVPDNIKVGDYLENAMSLHSPQATRTTKGCPRGCAFCGVSVIHPEYTEFDEWDIKPVIIDDNFMACSVHHFNSVIDKLKILDWCDFNQGIDPRFMTMYRAGRLCELRNPIIRLSFDSSSYESAFIDAYNMIRSAGMPKSNIRVFVMMGFNDSPEDALYRLRLVHETLKVTPNPMRYTPMDAKEKNGFVGENWTHKELVRFMKYWARLRYTKSVPFEEWEESYEG